MSCNCADCGKESDFNYMYREKKGKSVFTGFIQKDNDMEQIYWIGKDEKLPQKHIDIHNQEDRNFFMNEMKQYD